jgi:hypothetical protein
MRSNAAAANTQVYNGSHGNMSNALPQNPTYSYKVNNAPLC